MSVASRAPPPNVDITEEAQLQDPSLDRSDSLDQKLPLMANLSGAYSLESSGTERYDLYIDRAAAYDKAQQHAHRNSRHSVCSHCIWARVLSALLLSLHTSSVQA